MPTYTGTASGETLTGSAGDDVIDGRGGNDLLFGLGGADVFLYRPGYHIQTADEGDGSDTIDGGEGIDSLSVVGIAAQGFSGRSSYYDPMTYSLAAGAGGAAVFGMNQVRGVYGESQTSTDRLVTMQGVETASFVFTADPPPPPDGGFFTLFWTTSDVLTIGDLTGTALTGRIDFDGGHGNDTLNAGAAVNQIVALGGAGNDALTTGAGDDQLSGGDGDDTLRGGAGANSLSGGAGTDTADYSAAAQGLHVDLNDGVASNNGFGGQDIVSGVENLVGGAFNDILIGEGSANRISGGAGADYLIGLGGDDTLDGGAGALNSLQGGLGNDTYRVFNIGDTLTEFADEGLDTVITGLASYTLRDHFERLIYNGGADFTGRGNAAGNEIVGGSGIDRLHGMAGDDTLIGGLGNDILSGGAGQDVLDGGTSTSDTADYSLAAGGVFATLDQAVDMATDDGDGGSDTLIGIENLTGSAFNDTLIGDGVGNVLTGGLGRDVLLGLGGNDLLIGGEGSANQLQGGLGDDRYRISTVGDTLIERAGEGSDTVEASLSAYTLRDHFEHLRFNGVGPFTGTGNSLANGVFGGASGDTLSGLGGDDSLSGAAGDDILIGGAGADYLDGGAGADVLRGGTGNDNLHGGADQDMVDYHGAASGVTVRLATQVATNDGDGGSDIMSGIEGVIGSAFNDSLLGSNSQDTFFGGDGADLLIGYSNNDVLSGGAGAANTMQGGDGDDRYIVASAGDTLVEFANEGTDTVETALAGHTLRANFENLVFTGAGAFAGTGNGLANAITGGAGADTLTGAGGNDLLNGGLGTDTAVVSGARADYVVTTGPGYFTVADSVAGRDGIDTLYGIERIRFGDGSVLDLTAPVSGAEMAEAVLARISAEPDLQTGDTARVAPDGWGDWDTM